jgi:Flp pilus assembly protein TadB
MLKHNLRTGDEHEPEPRPPKPPLQFSLRTLLALPVAVGLLFGTLRWLDVPPLASVIVLVVLIVGVVAALGLLAAIAASDDDELQ